MTNTTYDTYLTLQHPDNFHRKHSNTNNPQYRLRLEALCKRLQLVSRQYRSSEDKCPNKDCNADNYSSTYITVVDVDPHYGFWRCLKCNHVHIWAPTLP